MSHPRLWITYVVPPASDAGSVEKGRQRRFFLPTPERLHVLRAEVLRRASAQPGRHLAKQDWTDLVEHSLIFLRWASVSRILGDRSNI
jgi:hypothetical protein